MKKMYVFDAQVDFFLQAEVLLPMLGSAHLLNQKIVVIKERKNNKT